MANQVTPKTLLQLQLHDWNVLLAQLEQNPDTPPADVAFSKGKIQQIQEELQTLSQ